MLIVVAVVARTVAIQRCATFTTDWKHLVHCLPIPLCQPSKQPAFKRQRQGSMECRYTILSIFIPLHLVTHPKLSIATHHNASKHITTHHIESHHISTHCIASYRIASHGIALHCNALHHSFYIQSVVFPLSRLELNMVPNQQTFWVFIPRTLL